MAEQGFHKRFYATAEQGGSINIGVENWLIGSILIDNAASCWLYINGLNRYIPPHTLGYSCNLVPYVQAITLRFSEPPSGGAPSIYEGTITITAFSIKIGENVGTPYTIYGPTVGYNEIIRTTNRDIGDPAIILVANEGRINRKYILVQSNADNVGNMFIGASDVDENVGIVIEPGGSIGISLGPDVDLWGFSDSIGIIARIMELA
jgi:hypothetical protein